LTASATAWRRRLKARASSGRPFDRQTARPRRPPAAITPERRTTGRVRGEDDF
jgi:hypothetical protein